MPRAPDKMDLMEAEIERRGGEGWVFDQIAEGKKLGAIAHKLGVSRPYLYVWRDARADRQARWEAAMKASAEVLVESGGAILDRMAKKDVITSPEVQLASKRADYRKFMAAIRNPMYSENKGAQLNVNLSFSDLHIDALRMKSVGSVVEAEVLEGGGVDVPLLESGEE